MHSTFGEEITEENLIGSVEAEGEMGLSFKLQAVKSLIKLDLEIKKS
jgi:hypothetical protein